MIKRKVFLSYDVDRDEKLREPIEKIFARADSPFEVIARSTKVTEPVRNWEYGTGRAFHGCELMIVLLGPNTHKAPGVRKEAAIAVDEEIPIIQIIGYKNAELKPVPGAGRAVPWNWEALKKMV